MPLISSLRTQNQADLSVFEVSLMYTVSFRIARATCLETNKQNIIHLQRMDTIQKGEKK